MKRIRMDDLLKNKILLANSLIDNWLIKLQVNFNNLSIESRSVHPKHTLQDLGISGVYCIHDYFAPWYYFTFFIRTTVRMDRL